MKRQMCGHQPLSGMRSHRFTPSLQRVQISFRQLKGSSRYSKSARIYVSTSVLALKGVFLNSQLAGIKATHMQMPRLRHCRAAFYVMAHARGLISVAATRFTVLALFYFMYLPTPVCPLYFVETSSESIQTLPKYNSFLIYTRPISKMRSPGLCKFLYQTKLISNTNPKLPFSTPCSNQEYSSAQSIGCTEIVDVQGVLALPVDVLVHMGLHNHNFVFAEASWSALACSFILLKLC